MGRIYSSLDGNCECELVNHLFIIHSIAKQKYVVSILRSAVRLGEWDTTKDVDCEEEDNCADPVQDIPVSELIPHDSYVPTSKDQKNDIALIRLSRPAQFTDWIKPICLPVSQHLRGINFDGVALTVAGWGKTENGN